MKPKEAKFHFTNPLRNKIKYEYNEKEQNINGYLKVSYEYESNGNKTSTILSKMTIDNDTYKYIYDDIYNITDIYKNDELIHHYEYDNFSELVKEVEGTNSIVYTYDNAGNILKKQEYIENVLQKEDTYEYNNNNWKDQLTKFNNTTITYDEIGNPLTIGTNTLTWWGRQLLSYNNNQYEYDKDGIRNKKIVNGIETKYFTENNAILFEETNGNMLYYIRDDNNNLLGFTYNNTTYYYKKNFQNDIIGIYNSNYEPIAEYEYDSWGKIISIKDQFGNAITDQNHIAIINPFRYRSYYYDSETSLYYLNSRYYNPTWGRFLNADGIIGTSETHLGYNLYTYCENNPLKFEDPDGSFGLVLGLGILAAGVLLLAAAPYVARAIQPAVNSSVKYIDNIKEKKKEKEKADTKAIEKAAIAAKRTQKTQDKPCTTAKIQDGDVKRENRLTIDQSYRWVDNGGNVMCDNRFYAEQVAMKFNGFIGPEIDVHQKPWNKYYYHFHPDDHITHRHIWYLS